MQLQELLAANQPLATVYVLNDALKEVWSAAQYLIAERNTDIVNSFGEGGGSCEMRRALGATEQPVGGKRQALTCNSDVSLRLLMDCRPLAQPPGRGVLLAAVDRRNARCCAVSGRRGGGSAGRRQ